MKSVLFYCIVFLIVFVSCSKGEFEAQGGELPTNNIIVKDSTFTPSVLTLASGSSITFVNNTTTAHTIVSDDSIAIRPVTVAPGAAYFYKKDTTGTISYHCALHPNARGTIILLP